MRTRPGRSRSRLRRDYRGGGGLLPSRWRESCDYPAATIRGAALSERLWESQRLSRAKWSATIERLLSDYRRANPAPKFFQTFQKLFKNPIRIFSKPFEKSSGFSAPRVRSCRGRTVSARGSLAVSEAAGNDLGALAAGSRACSGRASPAAGVVAAVGGDHADGVRASWLRLSCCCNSSVGRVHAHYGVLMARDRYLYPLV